MCPVHDSSCIVVEVSTAVQIDDRHDSHAVHNVFEAAALGLARRPVQLTEGQTDQQTALVDLSLTEGEEEPCWQEEWAARHIGGF